MHDRVLVPEGRTDFDLIQLMVSADETRRATTVQNNNQPEFGSLVGTVPTHEGQVQGVFEELSKIHHSVVCLVDGDNAGNGYAANLAALQTPPTTVLQWPADWHIEDVVGWIANADAATVLPWLSAALGVQFATVGAFVPHMKTLPRDGGAKGDPVAYEMMVETLADSDPCLERMRVLLHRLAEACLGGVVDPVGWARTATSTATTRVFRFVP
jgi:hypothetical protein